MQKYILTLDRMEIVYTLKRRAYQRRVNLIVHQDGQLVVTAPKTYPHMFVEKALRKNKKWLIDKIAPGEKVKVNIDEKVVTHIKKKARTLVKKKLAYFNKLYGFSHGRIAIRNQKTVWGSCSEKGNLNFNCRIVCLPEDLQDYVIVHELCHLKELNHSPEFWQLVARTVPDFKKRRAALRKMRV